MCIRDRFYDPVALTTNRIVLAALSTAEELPQGKFRIARVHLQISGSVEPDYLSKLVVAAASDGSAIPSKLSINSATSTGDSQ